jgi:hypothetical protein
MSLATLARKTRTKKRMNTRGKFILNMTGRGNVLGMNAKMSRGNCKGLTKCAGKRAACCVGVGGDASGCCRFPHGGKPAPQMGYGVYLNRKSKGAYHPGGGKQCKTLPGCQSAKTVWKQGSNLDASVVITNKKDNVLACNSDVYTAKRDTCTGCPVGATGNFTVGQIIDVGEEYYGFDENYTNGIGAFVPPIINGNTVVSLLWLEVQGSRLFYLWCSGILAETMFSSISFVNCEEKTVRTYYQGAHDGYTKAGFTTILEGFSFWSWDAASSGFSVADEQTYWQGAAGKKLQVYIDNPNPPLTCPQCCCPVKKNICGCRATDLLRYTRINKSFGCQTTKAVRMGRSASEQIARRRAAVDCIKPEHRTIYMTISNPDGIVSFDGCCGDQCLISGQSYTFVVQSISPYLSGVVVLYLYFGWCGISNIDSFPTNMDDPSDGLWNKIAFPIVPGPNKINIPLTVPNTNCNNNGGRMYFWCHADGPCGTEKLSLDYCKQAFKRPQMLGSCSGR